MFWVDVQGLSFNLSLLGEVLKSRQPCCWFYSSTEHQYSQNGETAQLFTCLGHWIDYSFSAPLKAFFCLESFNHKALNAPLGQQKCKASNHKVALLAEDYLYERKINKQSFEVLNPSLEKEMLSEVNTSAVFRRAKHRPRQQVNCGNNMLRCAKGPSSKGICDLFSKQKLLCCCKASPRDTGWREEWLMSKSLHSHVTSDPWTICCLAPPRPDVVWALWYEWWQTSWCGSRREFPKHYSVRFIWVYEVLERERREALKTLCRISSSFTSLRSHHQSIGIRKGWSSLCSLGPSCMFPTLFRVRV